MAHTAPTTSGTTMAAWRALPARSPGLSAYSKNLPNPAFKARTQEPQTGAWRNQMAMFDSTIEDVAGRFGLGSKTAPLLREVMNLMTNSPGGIGGFINKFKSAGLGSQVASWLGRTDGAALSAPDVEKALGNTTLSGIAGRLGLGGSAVATAIGYVVPKLIGQLTPGGVVPTGIPAALSAFLSSPVQTATHRVEQVAPKSMTVIPDAPHLGRWLIPLLAGAGRARALLVPKHRQSTGAGRGDACRAAVRPACPVNAGAAHPQ